MPKEEKKTDLAIPVAGALDVSKFAGFEGMGLEEIGANDLIIPRLVILQSTSPAVQDPDSELRPGELYNITTNECYGRELEFIALAYWLTRTKWETPDINSPIECVAPDGIQGTKYGKCDACPHAKWQGDKPPLCTDFKNLLIIPKIGDNKVVDSPFMIYAAKRTAIRAMNRLLTALKQLKVDGVTPPIFATVWKLRTVAQKNQQKGATYYTPEFTRSGFVTSEMVPQLIQRFQEFKMIREEAIKANATAVAKDNENFESAATGGDVDTSADILDDDSNIGY